jgi:hypothetical protein
MAAHGSEVLICVQQDVLMQNTEGRNDHVNRLSNGHAAGSQDPVVLGRLKRDDSTSEIRTRKPVHQQSGAAELDRKSVV